MNTLGRSSGAVATMQLQLLRRRRSRPRLSIRGLLPGRAMAMAMALILALALAPESVLPALGVAATAADLDPSAVGPHGGRLLQSKPLATEYVVADDRKVEVYFFDKDMKPAPPREALVQLQAEAPSGIVALELEKAGDHLASREPLPGNPPHRLIVELRASPEAEPMILRIVVQPVGGKVPLIPTP